MVTASVEEEENELEASADPRSTLLRLLVGSDKCTGRVEVYTRGMAVAMLFRWITVLLVPVCAEVLRSLLVETQPA